jgi:A/G-specific adenine glycosylase
MPWRDCDDPYKVLVSEIMLQQTQVPRVLIKYPEFISQFPTFESLANASLKEVIATWQGMGYNRRAKYLKLIAEQIISEYGGKLPDNPIILDSLPGIGPGTAGSLAVFAYNKPAVFIETNIRRVFIHFFFQDQEDIDDKQIYPLVEQSLSGQDPRQWYYALMDYGVHLKKLHKNPSRRSVHHAKQSKFQGSDRQIRGEILRLLLQNPSLTTTKLRAGFSAADQDRAERLAHRLREEGFIEFSKNTFRLKKENP